MANVSSSNSQGELVPRLRFPGFEGEWDEKTLADFLSENTTRNRDGRFEKREVLSVSGEFGIVNQMEFQGRSFAGESVADYHVVETGDIVYTKSPLKASPYGIIKHNSGVPGIVSTLYAVYHPRKSVNSKFVDYYFQNDLRLNKYLKPLVNIGAKHDMKVNNEAALMGTVVFPDKKEQDAIVDFLSIVDTRIDKQRQLIEFLKSYKRGAVSALFPMEGESQPRYRLDGFSEPWVPRKFCEIAQRQSETMMSNSDNPCVEYDDVIAGQGTLNKDVYGKRVYKNGIRFTPDDVLYGKLRPYLHNWLNPNFSGVAVGDWWVLKPISTDKNFLFRLIQTPQYDNAANQSSGTKMPRADWKLISNLEIQVPTSIDEQSRIAKVFDEIDSIITFHQRMYDALLATKDALLQQMFI